MQLRIADTATRPERAEDMPFIERLYHSTRAEELQLTGWESSEITAFLRQQCHAQHRFYTEQFESAEFAIIERAGRPIGRLYTDVRVDEIRVIDIALLPEWRGKGLGGAYMEAVLAAAQGMGKWVRIHVEKNNPALRLYHRLGFSEKEDKGVYWLMEHRPLDEEQA
ncbi:MAG: GNAT family N-acetyltransferase [Myxococcales bacterium]|nr:GNAT family N-acetyltransferase [Myxococcales bacterium]